MRNFCLITFLLLCYNISIAQYPKLVVYFKDKGGSSFSLANPAAYLSTKSINRRQKQSIAYDSTDLPVLQRYIDSVISKGSVTVLSRSKWLNAILIQCTDAATITRIRQLPFVKSANGVGNRTQGINNPVSINLTERKQETVGTMPLQHINNRQAADVYNYANAAVQISLHNGQFLHNKGFRGQGMLIAMLDGGYNSYKTIAAFDSVRNEGRIIGERDFVAFDNSVNEDDAHGMHCLSTIAANWPGQMVGTAPKANFWLLRTENSATEYPIEEFNWVVGAEFADSCGVDMISSSLGYIDFDDPQFNYSYADFYQNKSVSSIGATWAAKKGIIVMNSAGNSGAGSWRYLGFPSDADSVCAVAACGADKSIASFSSWGYPGRTKPNVTAMGLNATVAIASGATTSSGTSFSNPVMAGLVACLWQAFPNVSNMKILDALYRSADRYTLPTDRFGYGLPNMKTAYRILKAAENTQLYGSVWLFATPNPFNAIINVKLIARADTTCKIELINSSNVVVNTINLTTEKEEVYDVAFNNLESLPDGQYSVKYTDALGTTISIALSKTNTTLPKLFNYLNGVKSNNGAALTFSVANDVSVANYTIERSTNGTNYAVEANILAKNITGNVQYNFFSNKPITSITYFRIKASLKNGSIQYSTTIQLTAVNSKSNINILPNPASNTIYINHNGNIAAAKNIKVIDANGAIVLSVQNPTALNNVFQVQVANLSSGIYFVELTNELGEIFKTKFLKQ